MSHSSNYLLSCHNFSTTKVVVIERISYLLSAFTSLYLLLFSVVWCVSTGVRTSKPPDVDVSPSKYVFLEVVILCYLEYISLNMYILLFKTLQIIIQHFVVSFQNIITDITGN